MRLVLTTAFILHTSAAIARMYRGLSVSCSSSSQRVSRLFHQNGNQ
jgi:hypothetical protein